MRRPLVYLAAPYTRPDPIENTHRICKLATTLVNEGWCIPLVPHLTLLWHAIDPHPIEWWYQYDLDLLARCDAVWRIHGDSTGADAEVARANDLGIPVFYGRDDCHEWAIRVWEPAA